MAAKPKVPKSLVGPLKKSDTTIRRAPKPTNVGRVIKPKIYALATGSPSEMTTTKEYPPQLFTTEEGAKNAAIDFFEEKRFWCTRFNQAGLKAIDAAVGEVQAMSSLLKIPRTVVCCIDEYTNMRIAVKLWVTADPPKEKT